ncbi:putative transcriptional regulator [Candidatus Nitrososphaera evergladensis SR1]|jgi:sugar-specific transcriptional regulator TrmB|uniref:Putative transcriptional regulator n=1 Tax=Candidatus Nitrososphaera evergladensis SR1 TaxID=1459636 RepID=A0A075MTZ2_9ARCH|nr:helix-turn-helix domain-containing protein [Candidatus Nitrososphaera evergladensis]AIF82719.1 putative transcriptional regulator [Candidatus Nitrososphaera evergladensis SR1]
MAVNLSNVEQAIIEELKISPEEARAYVAIVKSGKMDAARISKATGIGDEKQAQAVAKSLVGRGMVIEITAMEFESLHPRFAVTNRYRRRCAEDNIPFKKNLRVDNIGIVLEKPFEDARTK